MKSAKWLSLVLIVSLAGCKNADSRESSCSSCKGPEMSERQKLNGLEYEVIKAGTGASPQARQKVTVHYTGWLDVHGKPGTKFDSSVDRGTPFSFIIGVGQVIKGWDEGVKTMKVGEKRRLFIPSSMGYGARGAGAAIPPHANLIFDVELLQVS